MLALVWRFETTTMAEIGLAILILAVLLFTDKNRVQWLLRNVQRLVEWLSAE